MPDPVEPVLPEKPIEGDKPKPEVKPEIKPDAQPEKKPDAASPEKKSPESLLDKKTDEPKPVAVPEKYADFKTPEGVTLDADMVKKFDEKAKLIGLSQENRDSLIAMQVQHTEAQIKQTMDVFNKQIQDWRAETTKELGADTDKALAVASKGIDAIFTDPAENRQFRDMMKETGLGNWKLMVKAFSHVGKTVSEDKFVGGKPASEGRKSNMEILFDHPSSKVA